MVSSIWKQNGWREGLVPGGGGEQDFAFGTVLFVALDRFGVLVEGETALDVGFEFGRDQVLNLAGEVELLKQVFFLDPFAQPEAFELFLMENQVMWAEPAVLAGQRPVHDDAR